ncbi:MULTISPECIES: hypothetical protein [unclassified Duganella]|uniref:hypothetical protein n=1 Tax=unclassified Duganella TaxID=2636909 RepID=UPI0008885CBF|nr:MULTISPECIES: hypothetical protein [unclassified Duganella]SDF98963.1 hypothetical protein SAMN05216320_102279 [Duganella sp. OV458]SDJ05911.1 hypothetical protein SAMN05428973_102272 [Duganella sp. OV510]
MIKRTLLLLLLLSANLAAAAELTEMEIRWLKAGSAVLNYAKQQLKLPIDITVQPQARANDVPLALGYDKGRCKLVLSMRGNPNAEDILNHVPATQQALMIEAMVAHEIGHCWRYAQGSWHAVPAGFEERPAPAGAEEELRDTRREEGFADLVALAWIHQQHPQQYASVAAWMRSVREPSAAAGTAGSYGTHSTLSWLQLAPTGAAFTPGLPIFEQASVVWRQGLLRDQ